MLWWAGNNSGSCIQCGKASGNDVMCNACDDFYMLTTSTKEELVEARRAAINDVIETRAELASVQRELVSAREGRDDSPSYLELTQRHANVVDEVEILRKASKRQRHLLRHRLGLVNHLQSNLECVRADLERAQARGVEWIPVDERMPDDGEVVLVTVKRRHGIRILFAAYNSEESTFNVFASGWIEYSVYGVDSKIVDPVLAWAKQPQPYVVPEELDE